jgi:DMSO reductase family type II enzyme chaperone
MPATIERRKFVQDLPSRIVIVSRRDAPRSAAARSQCYAAFSELTASPHEVDPAPAAAHRLGIAAGLPFPIDGFDELLREFAAADNARLRSEYSGLFEIGSQGPPAPIREDLQTGQRAGTREDIVRFYDYFGYRLDDRFAWAPDHLSVELEFMHFLCFHEGNSEPGDCLSWQLGQADFAERHLANWVPQLAGAVSKLAADSVYCRVLSTLRDFIVRDRQWQASTIAC